MMKRIHFKAINSLIGSFSQSVELCLYEISFPESWGNVPLFI